MGTTLPDLESAKDYIYNTLDLTMLEKKLTHKSYIGNRWYKKDLAVGIQLYKNFLYLNAVYFKTGEDIIPSVDIDEIWHNHILDTHAYFKDCQNIFGEFLHHYPYAVIDKKTTKIDLNRSYKRSQLLYFKLFGSYY